MSRLLQVDTTGNITLVDYNSVTRGAEDRVTKELVQRDTQQTIHRNNALKRVEDTVMKRVDTVMKRVDTTNHNVGANKGRIHDLDRFVLSQPGQTCPTGYKKVTNRNQCKQFVQHIRSRGYASHGHEYSDFNHTSWGGRFTHGCFMVPGAHDRVHFNNSTASSNPAADELGVCVRT